MNRLKTIKWLRHVESMWEMKMHTELWIENIREEDQICDVNIKMELEEADVTTKLHSSGSGQELKVDFR